VGGYVRDRLLGAPTADVDVLLTGALRAVAERVGAQLGAAVVPLGEMQPTIRLVFPDRSHVDLSVPRSQPQSEIDQGGNTTPDLQALCDDLRLRDFTINAMAVPLAAVGADEWRQRIVDPTGGREDLRRRAVRATSPAAWQDDPVRLWRALRIAAQLGFKLDGATEAGIREYAGLAAAVAGERIRDELFSLLARGDADAWLARAARLGLLFVILPELAALQSLAQGGYHHLDGWRHTLAVVAQIDELIEQPPGMSDTQRDKLRRVFAKPIAGQRARPALLKLAGLLHDIGKPAARSEDEEGRVHFYGHEKLGAALASDAAHRLRLGRREVQYLEALTRLHMHPGLLAQQQELSRRAAHRFFRKAGSYAPDVLILAWADRLSARGPAACPEHIERVQQVIRWLLGEWLERGPLSHPQPPVGGRAIMRRYGLPSGPEVGKALKVLSRRHAEQPFMDAEAAWAFLDRVVRRPRARDIELQDDSDNE
jgi:putative nucleotidyltransferase with HDIG domain